MNKRFSYAHRWVLLALLIAAVCAPAAPARAFVHPGGLHTRADLDRMRARVAAGEHPWIDDWNRLIADPLARDTYRPSPESNMGVSRQRASRDAHAAYLNTLRWYISGDTRCADCAIRICNSWSAAVNQVPSGRDIPGLSGIPITEFALVGELLRICPRWTAADFARFKNMMLTDWYPAVHQFLTTQNGPGNTHFWANWNICNIGACIAIGVLCDNRAIFDEGIRYFKSRVGTGSIWNAVYYVHPNGLGQWQESGRDQEHAQLGVGLMAQLCQVAWNQGVDLYGYGHNRLLAGAEYVARWNLWKPVPYRYYTNSDHANQSWPSINARGRLDDRPIWELLYNHYVVLKGMRAPNVQAMAQLMRPEHGSGDHFGYGTLTFTLDAAKSPYPPSPAPPAPPGLTAAAGIGRVFLRWTRSGDTAQGYDVRRATMPGGPYEIIASWTDSTRCEETDRDVTPGTTYTYVVAAQNQSGRSGESAPASATPAAPGALPPGWTPVSIGAASGVANGASAGFAPVNGGTFLVSGAGAGTGGNADGLCYVSRSVTGDAVITARLAEVNWNHGGGAAKVGIMMRESLAPDPPTLVMKLGDIGARQAGFGTRSSPGRKMSWARGNDYTCIPAWFRLERAGSTFTAYESSDGVRWFRVGSSTVPMVGTYRVGLAVSSNSDAVNTSYFDHVTVAAADRGDKEWGTKFRPVPMVDRAVPRATRTLAPLGIASYGPPLMTPALLARAGATLWLGGSQINFAVQNAFRSGFLPSLNVGKTLAAQGGCTGDCVNGGALNHEWMDRTAALAVKSTASPGGWYVVGNEVEDSFSDDIAPTQAAYGAQLDAWVAALRAHDPEAHIVGPNFTQWDAGPNPVAYPWGPPQRWWRQFLNAYRAAHHGKNPPFAVLSFHDYLPVHQPPSTTMLDHFAAQARHDGYPAPVWITESAVNFLQPASQPLSETQQKIVTAFIGSLRADRHLGRIYYFTQAYPGFDNITGDRSSLRSVYHLDGTPTEVAAALEATERDAGLLRRGLADAYQSATSGNPEEESGENRWNTVISTITWLYGCRVEASFSG